MPQPNSNEENTKSDDLIQYKVVSHNPSSKIDNLCANITTNVDLSGFTHVDFDKLGKFDKNKVEEAIYDMRATLKKNPLEIANS